MRNLTVYSFFIEENLYIINFEKNHVIFYDIKQIKVLQKIKL